MAAHQIPGSKSDTFYDRQMDKLDGLIELKESWLKLKDTPAYDEAYVSDLTERIAQLNRKLS